MSRSRCRTASGKVDKRSPRPKSTARICQVGTQQRSDPMQAEIKKFLHEEKALGEISSRPASIATASERPIGKRSTPLTDPASVDYDLWLGPAQDKPIYRDNLHYDWHWDWNTGSGEMGNWGVHVLDDLRNNVFQDKVIVAQTHIWAAAAASSGTTPARHRTCTSSTSIPAASRS